MTGAEREPTVLVVDFGAQYAQLIARRVREAHVRSEIVPRDITKTRSHSPASSIGSLDFTRRAAPASQRARSAA